MDEASFIPFYLLCSTVVLGLGFVVRPPCNRNMSSSHPFHVRLFLGLCVLGALLGGVGKAELKRPMRRLGRFGVELKRAFFS